MSSYSLRRRRNSRQQQQATSEEEQEGVGGDFMDTSVTELPVMQENGQPAMETTDTPRIRSYHTSSSTDSSTMPATQDRPDTVNRNSSTASNSSTGQQESVAKAESKVKKIMTRAISGALIIGIFVGLVYMGHLYVCLLVALVELLLVS